MTSINQLWYSTLTFLLPCVLIQCWGPVRKWLRIPLGLYICLKLKCGKIINHVNFWHFSPFVIRLLEQLKSDSSATHFHLFCSKMKCKNCFLTNRIFGFFPGFSAALINSSFPCFTDCSLCHDRSFSVYEFPLFFIFNNNQENW